MNAAAVRRDRLFRRDRRSGLQADLSGAAGAGARRGAERARSSASPRPAGGSTSCKRARQGQPAASRRLRRSRLRSSCWSCCAMSTATTTIRRLSRPAASSSARRSGRCTIWRCRRACSASSSPALAKSGCTENARLVIEKPFGHNRASARALNRTLLEHFPGGEHLPHRPLPRQGAGAEHRLYALRQLDVRADLESPACPQHPDHHGREFRRRGSRPLLRRDRRDPRRGAEPHAAGAGAT